MKGRTLLNWLQTLTLAELDEDVYISNRPLVHKRFSYTQRRIILTKGLPVSTHDVPGAKTHNNDILAMGSWAEHDDGSLIFVESVEAGTVVYSIFDVAQTPPVEYRDAMPEQGFKDRFSWKIGDTDQWTWHDKTPFDWQRVMGTFPAGQKAVSKDDVLTAAQRVAQSLNLRAEAVRERVETTPWLQRTAQSIMQGVLDAVEGMQK